MVTSLESQKESLIDYWKRESVVKNREIIKAFREVKREDFVLPEYKKMSYLDSALPLIKNQTISQPTTVAIMTQILKPKKGQKILEIGSGSGYQAAILSRIVGSKGRVHTIEIVPELYEYSKEKLSKFRNVKVHLGDGSKGLEKYAPFDRIIVTAGASDVPRELVKQLKVNGLLVIPLGVMEQKMITLKKTSKGIKEEDHGYFMFVPLIRKK